MLFFKRLKNIDVPETQLLEEIKSSNDNVWFTAKSIGDHKINMVKDKPNGGFYLARIKKFPKVLKFVEEVLPDAIISNSYITKCYPKYIMEKHIDPGRSTAIIIPLGTNKGFINFFFKDIKISTCVYQGPTLSRVDVVHSAVNDSDEIRYGLTIEIKGSYWKNFVKYS
jgi:hypothetical protein